MALIRRCGGLLSIRTKFTDKYKSCLLEKRNTDNVDYVSQLKLQIRTYAQYELNESENFQTDSNRDKFKGMCYAEVKKLVDNNKNSNLSRREESFALNLLKHCQDMLPDANLTQRQNLVHRAWSLVELIEQNLTVEHYNILLSVYASNSQYFNGEEFLKNMKVKPDKDTYALLIDVLAEVGDHLQIFKIMGIIKDMGYPVNEAMFNSLILAHMVKGDIDGAQEVVNTMQATMIEMSRATYCALSRGYAINGDLKNLKQSLKKGNLSTKELMLVVKSLSKFGHGEHICQAMKHLPYGFNVHMNDIVSAIVELTYLGKARDALEVINGIPKLPKDRHSSSNALDLFLVKLVESGTSIEEILEICEKLISSGKCPTALLKIAEVSLRFKKEKFALQAFKALQNHGYEIRPHFYWPLLANAGANKPESDVTRLIKHMNDNKVYLDDETLQNYTFSFLSLTDPLAIVRKLQDCGLKISQLLTPLSATLLTNGNMKGAALLLDEITGKINKEVVIQSLLEGFLKTKSINSVVKILRTIKASDKQNGNFLLDIANAKVAVSNEEFSRLVVAFSDNNLTISRDIAEALRSRINRIREPANFPAIFEGIINNEESEANESSVQSFKASPECTYAEKLENDYISLSNNDGNTRGILRKLIQTHCGENNFSQAVKFASIFDAKGFDWTSGMLCAMLFLYAANNMMDEAEIKYKLLKKEHSRFKIDDHKILDYATVLVVNNKYNRAVEVLKEQENVMCSPSLSKNCWRLLNAVVASGDSKNVKNMLDLLIARRYCEINNHILGPLVKTHLVNGDLDAAIEQFEEFALTYRKVPLQQELMRAVINNCTHESVLDEKRLTKVLTISRNIYGDQSTNIHLFTALAATGRQAELHRLIESPNFNQFAMTLGVEKLTNEKDLTALKTILKACRGTNHLDTTILYDSILQLCIRSSDYRTALDIWEKMETEEVMPSPQFIYRLKKLLIAERVPLPPQLQFDQKFKKR